MTNIGHNTDQTIDVIIGYISRMVIQHPKRKEIIKGLIEYLKSYLSELEGSTETKKTSLSKRAKPSQRLYITLSSIETGAASENAQPVYFQNLSNLYKKLGFYDDDIGVTKLTDRYKNQDKLICQLDGNKYELTELGTKKLDEIKKIRLGKEDRELIDVAINAELAINE